MHGEYELYTHILTCIVHLQPALRNYASPEHNLIKCLYNVYIYLYHQPQCVYDCSGKFGNTHSASFIGFHLGELEIIRVKVIEVGASAF